MADVLRIKRRLTGGAAGAPTALANAELAYNEVDDKLYYGKGNNAGQATSIIPIAGPGMGYAPLASPVFTGDPKAPTPATADNDTSIATTAFVKAQGYLTGGSYLPLTGGTLTGQLGIAPASGNAQFVLQKPASGTATTIYGYQGANARWQLDLGNNAAESGSNAGSDFTLHRFSDAGAFLSTPLTIARATGAATFTGVSLTTSGPISAGNTTIPASGYPAQIYLRAVVTGDILSNLYINPANSQYMRYSGSGYGGVYSFTASAGQWTWGTTPAGAIDTQGTPVVPWMWLNPSGLTTTGPIVAGNKTLPPASNVATGYYGDVLASWISFNTYVNSGATGWQHYTGTGTVGVMEYNATSNQFNWYTGANAAVNAAIPILTTIMSLNSGGGLVTLASVTAGIGSIGKISLNPGLSTNSGFLRITNAAGTSLGYLGYDNAIPAYTIENASEFDIRGGNFVVTAGQVLSRGTGAMIAWDQRDNVGVQWAWYSTAGAARLWYSPSGDRVTVDTGGNLVAQAGLQANSGRIISTTPTASAGAVVCCYEVPSGYAAGILQTTNIFYLARMDGAGNYHSTLAYFDLSIVPGSTAMTMGGAGIRYPAAAYGSANVIAFGWGTYPAFPGHVAVSIDNGGAAYPLANASDARMKTDIAPSKFDALATINQIPLKEFRWIDMSAPHKLKEARAHKKTSGSLKRIGVIAQEVAKIFPEGVVRGDDHEDKLGLVWTLDHNIMIAALIGAIQQLTKRLEAVEGTH